VCQTRYRSVESGATDLSRSADTHRQASCLRLAIASVRLFGRVEFFWVRHGSAPMIDALL
jgi:hypothetical protein